MLKDVRFGFRVLMKQPGFSLIAVLTLALGIGATAAVFSLIQGVLLTAPPYRDPNRLVLVQSARSDGELIGHARGWSAEQWLEWQKRAKSFESIGAYSWSFNYLVFPQGSVSLEGMWVTADYFRVLALEPLIGRTFLASEISAQPPRLIVLGYDLWQRQFHGDLHIVGKTLHLSRNEPYTVIGVMRPGVRFLPTPGASQEPNYNVNATVDYWTPAGLDPAHIKEQGWDVLGRLRGGARVNEAQSELAVLITQQARSERNYAGIVPRLQPLRTEMNQDGGRILWPLCGAAALVLLIACGNAASLLLVRGLQRQQEYAVRSALGVGRIALFRQVATESLLVALAGGAMGIGLAFGIVRVFRTIAVHAIPRLDAVTAGWPVLACGLGSAVFAAVLAGLIPALRASGLDPVEVLKSAGPKSSAGIGERRLLRGVTVVQTALTLALLVGAGLLIRTMMNLANVQSGYDTTHILTMSVTAVQGNWGTFHHRALERVSAIPGVERAAFAWGVPLTGNNWPWTMDVEGQPPASKASDRTSFPVRAVTPGYFALMSIPITQGRDFRDDDTGKDAKVAVVNEAFASRYFPNGPVLGKKLWMYGHDNPPVAIVGVVANGRMDDLTQAAAPEIYCSLWQQMAFSKDLVIRTAGDPRAVVASVQRELRAVDPTVAVEHVRTLEQVRGDSLASRTFAMQLLVGFSIVGSVLTLVGIYGMPSLSVTSRRREIAIRTAIGAQQRDIRNLVFGEGFRLIAGGVVSGIVAAILVSRVLRSLLFEVQPNDPLTLIGVAMSFAAVALLACWAPTRRAVKVAPVEALRYE
jgi:putative ABC transport system permease protein